MEELARKANAISLESKQKQKELQEAKTQIEALSLELISHKSDTKMFGDQITNLQKKNKITQEKLDTVIAKSDLCECPFCSDWFSKSVIDKHVNEH